MSRLEDEYLQLKRKGETDVASWLKAEMLKGMQEASIEEVEGPMIFGTNADGSPTWVTRYTSEGWPYIERKEPHDPNEHL